MLNSNKITTKFLNEFTSEEVRSTFETLNNLLESLENKPDPSPVEIQVVDSIYQFLEKSKVLEFNMRKYVEEINDSLPGNKLSDLYASSNLKGTFE